MDREMYLYGAHTVYIDLDVADEETRQWVLDEIKRQGKKDDITVVYWRSSEGNPLPPSREGRGGSFER